MAALRLPRSSDRKTDGPFAGIPFPGGTIRPWRSDDAKPLVALADNRRVWINLADRFPHPYTLADARRWIRGAALRHPPTDFAIECRVPAAGGTGAQAGSSEVPARGPGVIGSDPGVLAGGIGLLPGEDIRVLTAEIGYWLGEPYWGRGIATAAVSAFTSHAFATLGLRRVFARVLEWNPASARVLEKCGYVLEGRLRRSAIKDGKVADELLYARIAAM